MRYPNKNQKNWSSFNPSISVSPSGNALTTIRSSNYVVRVSDGLTMMLEGGHPRSRTWVSDVELNSLEVTNVREIEYVHPPTMSIKRGPEDPRLFWRDDSWYFTAVLFEPPTIPVARLALYKLDEKNNVAIFIKMYESPDPKIPEKNWMAPDKPTDAFDFVYSPTQVYRDNTLVGTNTSMTESVRKDRYLSSIRGGSGLLLQENGNYLAVVHDVFLTFRRVYNPETFGIHPVYGRFYRHYFAEYSSQGELINLSSPFIFKEPGIEFCSGLIEHEDNFVLSFGAKDLFACFGVASKEKVFEFLSRTEA